MGIKFMDYFVALRSSDLPGPQRAIALWIAGRCADGWNVKLDDVVSDSGFSRATVARAISELETKKWLIRCQNKKRGNRYEILIPEDIETSQSETSRSLTVRLRESPRKSQNDTSEVSERDVWKSHSETTYTRTVQEQEKTKSIVPMATRAPAREDIVFESYSNAEAYLWARKLIGISQAKMLAAQLFRGARGEVDYDTFATALYFDKKVFERFKPWLNVLRMRGEI